MQLTEEHKAKLKAGRERAAAERKAKGVKRAARRTRVMISQGIDGPVISTGFRAQDDFLGITKTDCPTDCTFERCVITGGPYCGHPCKGGIQPAQMQDRETVERYNRARKHLAHVELDKRP